MNVILKNGGEPNTPVWTGGTGHACIGPYGTNCGDPYWGWQDDRVFNYTNFDSSTSCSYVPDCAIAMVPSTGKWITTRANIARPVICEFVWYG
uniref:Uncharacterized protein n=1 Tax=Acrobeloides nanus TaxID=290746 RepID=A0A914CS28_9BILA